MSISKSAVNYNIQTILDALFKDGGPGRETIINFGNRPVLSWYPTGRVFFQDDMENLIVDPTQQRYTRDNGRSSRSDERSFSGQYSLKLTPGSNAGNRADASLYLALPPDQTPLKIGVELKFLIEKGPSALRSFKVSIAYYGEDGIKHSGGTYYYATWTTLREKWQYINNKGDFIDIFNQKLYMNSSEAAWNGVKLIVDFTKDEFVSFTCNNKTKDLSGIPLLITSHTLHPLLGIYFEVTNETALSVPVWIDDLILTEES